MSVVRTQPSPVLAAPRPVRAAPQPTQPTQPAWSFVDAARALSPIRASPSAAEAWDEFLAILTPAPALAPTRVLFLPELRTPVARPHILGSPISRKQTRNPFERQVSSESDAPAPALLIEDAAGPA